MPDESPTDRQPVADAAALALPQTARCTPAAGLLFCQEYAWNRTIRRRAAVAKLLGEVARRAPAAT
jgi:hypothetical protein